MSTEKQPQITIPFLPGYTSHHINRLDHRKPHSLDYKNGYPLKKKPVVGIGKEHLIPNELEKQQLEEELRQLSLKTNLPSPTYLHYGREPRALRHETKPFIPAHVAYDKLQTVHDSIEQYILRKVRILVYLEDDSISVLESPEENSGIPQGVLIKRQRLPKNESEYYTAKDFNLAQDITFYGKCFRITNCDRFTRQYMQETLKVSLNEQEAMPTDAYLESRNKPKSNPAHKVEHNDKLKKFLLNDRKVLRFYCQWDDRENMYGELRDFVIHYFLVDDSLEVREVQRPNQGRDECPILLRRQQIPKKYEGLDSLNGNNSPSRITWRDIRIGESINVLGRSMFVYDCDDYTRNYYKEYLGYKEEQLKPVQVNNDNSGPSVERDTPPYNGFGTLEDSMGSCKYLVLKPPKKDFIKMLENEQKVLRFVALLESKHREDANRQFVISYRLADDMLTIYEPTQRNAGFLAGKFLERTRALKPGHTLQNPAYYNAPDFYIGARVTINHYKFLLVAADEYVFKYMESNAEVFPQSNAHYILNKINRKLVAASSAGQLEQFKGSVKKAFSPFSKNAGAAAAGDGEAGSRSWVSKQNFEAVLSNLAQFNLTKHEIITLARFFDVESKNQVHLDKFFAEIGI